MAITFLKWRLAVFANKLFILYYIYIYIYIYIYSISYHGILKNKLMETSNRKK